jgi:hypothetical protein
MAIGVFGLQVAYKLKRLEIMSTDDTHGWFGGGIPYPNSTSTVDRIDFSNDTGTANIRGPLSGVKWGTAATGNSNFGWFGGGTPGPLSRVDRIDFSNDSSTASPRGPLSLARYNVAATGNSNYGWFGGGTPGSRSTVDRIDFSNDSSTASPRGPLSATKYEHGATGNSNYGWFGGGSGSNTVNRIDFSNDNATASPRSSFIEQRADVAATGNSNYGWFGGGTSLFSPPTGTVYYSTVQRIDFSNDSSSPLVRGSLSSIRGRLAATGNSNFGWFGGGGPSPAIVSSVDRINFSNDSVSVSPRGPLSSSRYSSAATSGQAKGPAIKLQKAGNYGWFGGGQTPTTVYSTVDRIDFSNDLATQSQRSTLNYTPGVCALAATGNSNYGWFGGGFVPSIPGRTSKVERIDFSNDSIVSSTRGLLTGAKDRLAATGNSNYGWFGGGTLNGVTAIPTVDRINFSNDLATASPRSPLSSAKYFVAATGNSNYGWFGGGQTPTTVYSTVDRIDFSNDLATQSQRSTLNYTPGVCALAATGNSNYGWFGGGFVPSIPGRTSKVERIDFSNDSIVSSTRGLLTGAKDRLTATGNSNYGWWGGGGFPATATVDRINFSNDLATASPRSPLSSAKYFVAATSNTPT